MLAVFLVYREKNIVRGPKIYSIKEGYDYSLLKGTLTCMPAPSHPHSSPQDADPKEHVLKHLSGKYLVSLRPSLTSQHQHSTCHTCNSRKIASKFSSNTV
jgi:hypothetical protein